MRLFQLTTPERPTLLDFALPEDRILLRQDATYLLLRNDAWPCPVFVLEQDLLRRGINCPANVLVVSDTEWVELTLKATQVITCLS